MLTEKNLSHVLSREGSRDNFSNQLSLAVNEPNRFLQENFSLSPVQQKVIASYTEQDWKSISEVLQKANDQVVQLQFRFNTVAEKSGCARLSAKAVTGKGRLLKEVVVTPRL